MNLKPHQSFLHILHPSLQATRILRLEQILPAPPINFESQSAGKDHSLPYESYRKLQHPFMAPSSEWCALSYWAVIHRQRKTTASSLQPTTANRALMPIAQWNELYHYRLQTSWTNSRLLHLRSRMNFCKSHYCQSIIKKAGSSPIASTWCHNEAHNSRIPAYK